MSKTPAHTIKFPNVLTSLLIPAPRLNRVRDFVAALTPIGD
jgi:hypothetical protein